MRTPNNKILTELPPLVEAANKKSNTQLHKQESQIVKSLNTVSKAIPGKRNPAKSAIVSTNKFKKP
jgi:hypothetical protein